MSSLRIPSSDRTRDERFLLFAFARDFRGRGLPSGLGSASAFFFVAEPVSLGISEGLARNFSGSHTQSARSVNSKPNLCNRYPTMLPALGQLAPTATPAPKASNPLRATFPLGMDGAFQRIGQKAIDSLLFQSCFGLIPLRALDIRSRST
jgi:hypothetical protein